MWEHLLAELRRRDVEYSWKQASTMLPEVRSEYAGRRKEIALVRKDIEKIMAFEKGGK